MAFTASLVSDYPRRDFLALSALGVLRMMSFRHQSRKSRDDDLLYVGTYTEEGRTDGIYLVRMDGRTGALRSESAVNAGPNPSFLATHPNGAVLYAVNEIAQGTVSAFAIDGATGTLTRINQRSSGGDAPCYVSLDRRGRVALVANYDSGTVAAIALGSDGSLEEPIHVERHIGKGPNAERQEGPHAHCIIADPTNRYALAADLGIDRVVIHRLGDDASLAPIATSDAVLRAGAGPRHLVFHPRMPLVYVANELDSTITTLQWDATRGALSVRESVSTVPPGWTGANFPADIHVDSSGRVLYVSNRGHNSIAVFSIAEDTGALTQTQVIATEGDWPRNFALHPSERWLLVANQRSGNVVVFARNANAGRLDLTTNRLTVPSPVCLRFAVARTSRSRP